MQLTTIIYKCDICNKEMDMNETCATENESIKINSIRINSWCAGIYSTSHVCTKCCDELIQLIKSMSPNKNFYGNWTKK